MSARLSCPSCNTAFALPAVPPDRRATCPRCGDVFPVRGAVAELTNDEGPAESAPPNTGARAPGAEPVARTWSVRRTALVALVLGLLGFAVGLTARYSRGPKPGGDPQPDAPVATTATPPAQLVGLGYLPGDYNVVFAAQPGPLLMYAARAHQDPRELLTRAGVPAPALATLDQSGLMLPQIEHVAGGVGDPDGGLRVALVLVLKQPLADEDEFLKKLKAKPVTGKKARYKGEFLDLARVSPTVWVFGASEKDFAAVDQGGFGPGGKQFRGSESEGLRHMLGSVPPEAAVWVAADDDRDWTQKPLVVNFLLPPEAKKGRSGLSSFRGGLFAVSFGEQPRMRLFVRTADSAVADRVRGYFQARATETEAATAGGGGVFALFDAPFDPATVRVTLQRFLADATK